MAIRGAGHHAIGTVAPSEAPVSVGYLWSDTSTNALKICTSISPYTFASVGGGGGSGTVTHSLGNLTTSRLVVGNAVDDVDVLASLGTTTTVLHGNAAGRPTFGAVDVAADVTGSLPIGNGGTGQAAKAAAFDALSPVTTRGDLIYRDATTNNRLAKGTSGQYLTIGANDPAWASVPGVSMLLGAGASAGHSPLAATSYFFATAFTNNPGTTAVNSVVFADMPCTIKRARFRMLVFGTKGTAAQVVTISIRVNDTTDTLIGTTDASLTFNDVVNTGLGISLAAGDQFEIKMATPAVWTTTPTAVFYQAQVWIEVP